MTRKWLDVHLAPGPQAVASSTTWRMGGKLRVTIIVKATFQLVPDGTATLVAPEEIAREDHFVAKNPSRSVEHASDLAPYLPGAGVTMVGHACSAGGPVTAASVRLAVFRMVYGGSAPETQSLLDRTIHVFGDRASPRDAPTPFTRIPLTYERAARGRDLENSVGVEPGTLAQPNLVDPRDPAAVACFAPASPYWKARQKRLGDADKKSLALDVPDLGFFDWRYFHAAPREQQIDFLRGDEWIVLDGVHPTRSRLSSQLPGVRARALLVHVRTPDAPVTIDMMLDTLAIDADREVASLVFRGFAGLDPTEDLEHVRAVAGLDLPSQAAVFPDARALAARPPAIHESAARRPRGAEALGSTAPSFQHQSAPTVLPFSAGRPSPQLFDTPAPSSRRRPAPELIEEHTVLGISLRSAALPFAGSENTAERSARPPDSPPSVHSGLPFGAPVLGMTPLGVPPVAAPAFVAPPTIEPAPASVPPVPAYVPPPAHMGTIAAPPPPAPPVPPPHLGVLGVPPEVTDDPSTIDRNHEIGPAEPPPPASLRAPASPPAPPFDGPAPDSPASASPASASPAGATSLQTEVVQRVRAKGALRDLDLAGADLSKLDLRGANLASLNLKGTNLTGCDLSGSNLSEAQLAGADLTDAKLAGADLARADLSKATLQNADFTGANVTAANFSGVSGPSCVLAKVRGRAAVFAKAVLDGATLDGAELVAPDFSGASLARASLRDASLVEAIFRDARATDIVLDGATLEEARADGATMTRASMIGVMASGSSWERADLNEAKLDGANLLGANMQRAGFARASLLKADLRGANLQRSQGDEAKLDGANLEGCDLRQSNLRAASLAGANLKKINGQKTDLSGILAAGVDLSGANLRGARMKKAQLDGAKIDGADLRDADLEDGSLGGVDRTSAKLAGANLKGVE